MEKHTDRRKMAADIWHEDEDISLNIHLKPHSIQIQPILHNQK
jgi:hypothetical protein